MLKACCRYSEPRAQIVLEEIGCAQLAERLDVILPAAALLHADGALLELDGAVELAEARAAETGVVQRGALDGGALDRGLSHHRVEVWQRLVVAPARDETHAGGVRDLRNAVGITFPLHAVASAGQ